MQLDKTKGYIFRVVDVEQAKAVVEVLVGQGYILNTWAESAYNKAVDTNISVNSYNPYICYSSYGTFLEQNTWVDTEMFLKYNPLPEVKETIQVGDTIFDKEEFELAVSKLKGVKA